MEKDKKILFDPGYAPLVINSLGQVGYLYYTFNAIKDLKIKRINYPIVYKKIEQHLKLNIAFYLGCLLWAIYIKQFDNYKIEGNQLYGEECEEKEYTQEIDFLINYVEIQIPRDSKYYLNKKSEINIQYSNILKAYKEFLIINSGFTNVLTTNQIKIPTYLKTPKDINAINDKIQKAIQEKNLEQLFDLYTEIFD